MTRLRAAAALTLAVACSDLPTADDGVAVLEVVRPTSLDLEAGATLQLTARALDRAGSELAVPINWRTPDTTILVEAATGRVTGLIGGETGRVQAVVGERDPLVSDFLTLRILAGADTMYVVGDSVLSVALAAPESAPLVVRVESLRPPGPLAGRSLIYRLVHPVFSDPAARTVEFSGGRLADTATTSTEGVPQAAVRLLRRAGLIAADSTVVQVTAARAGGAPVPGSGLRFHIRFLNQ